MAGSLSASVAAISLSGVTTPRSIVSIEALLPMMRSGFFGIFTSLPVASVTVYPAPVSVLTLLIPQPPIKIEAARRSAAPAMIFFFISPPLFICLSLYTE